MILAHRLPGRPEGLLPSMDLPISRTDPLPMFWSVRGVGNILAFRCIHASRRIDNLWKYRLNEHAALNDPLPLAA